MEIGKQTGTAIPLEDLDLVAVTTGNQDKTPVRRNSKIPRMKPRLLITNPRKQTRLGILRKYGKPVTFQPVAGIKELPVRRKVDVRTPAGMRRIGINNLQLTQIPTGIFINYDGPAKFSQDIHETTVSGEGEMPRPLPCRDLDLIRIQ